VEVDWLPRASLPRLAINQSVSNSSSEQIAQWVAGRLHDGGGDP